MSETLTKRQAFEQLIQPMVEAIRVHCKEHDIPALFDFQLDNDGDAQSHMMLLTRGNTTEPSQMLYDATLVLKEGSLANALASMVADAIPELEEAGGPVLIGEVKLNRKPRKDAPVNDGDPY